jgi:hypothetical protein
VLTEPCALAVNSCRTVPRRVPPSHVMLAIELSQTTCRCCCLLRRVRSFACCFRSLFIYLRSHPTAPPPRTPTHVMQGKPRPSLSVAIFPKDTLGRLYTVVPPSLSNVRCRARHRGQAAGDRLRATMPHRTMLCGPILFQGRPVRSLGARAYACPRAHS